MGWLDLFFPRRCAGCGAVGSWVCASCEAGVLERALPQKLSVGTALFDFSEPIVRELLHYLKYNGIYEAAPVLVELAKKCRYPVSLAEEVVLIPVPISAAKRKKRGYNQAELLAESLASWFNLPVWKGALRKVGRGESQVGRTASQRLQEVRGKFQVNFRAVPAEFAKKSWILVDDVYTTGSTLKECLSCLQGFSAVPIQVLAVAKDSYK